MWSYGAQHSSGNGLSKRIQNGSELAGAIKVVGRLINPVMERMLRNATRDQIDGSRLPSGRKRGSGESGFSLRYQTRHSLTSTYLFALPSLGFMLPT